MPYTRRDFLSATSHAVIGAHLGTRFGICRPSASALKRGTGNTLLPDPIPGDTLRALAAGALDAARRAGVSFADIRIANRQRLNVRLPLGGPFPDVLLGSTFSYGIRAMVDGAIAFDYGDIPTSDALAATARNAVTQARGFAKFARERAELVQRPAVTDAWISPVRIDPFAVPILEQADLLGAWHTPVDDRVEQSGVANIFDWERETRVVAATDGLETTQVVNRARPSVGATALWRGVMGLGLPEIHPQIGGYETVLHPNIDERLKALAEEAQRYVQLPVRPLDVGRYPVVLDGRSMAQVVASLLGPALQLDRVLGYEADSSGTSFLAPLDTTLGSTLFSPLLSLSADRPLADITGVRWDDEGVPPASVELIRQGQVVDYLTDRQTTPALQRWYTTSGRPYRSGGYAFAESADRPLLIGSGHLTMPAGPAGNALEDLYHDLSHGVLLVNMARLNTDQQLSSGFATTDGCTILEIRDGRIVSRIEGAQVEFRTAAFWKGLVATGDTRTVRSADLRLTKGQPWGNLECGATAPAGAFKTINVTRTRAF